MSEPKPECPCTLALEGAKLLSELALANGALSTEQMDRVIEHARKVNAHTAMQRNASLVRLAAA